MAVQVVDRHEREPPRPRERLRRREPDEQRADQPGPCVTRDPLDLVELAPASLERLAQDRRDELEMPPRGDLRHDAAVARVQLRLGGDDVGEDSPSSVTTAAAVSSQDVSSPRIKRSRARALGRAT